MTVTVDPPVVLDANYDFDKFDRRRIDNQIRALQTVIAAGGGGGGGGIATGVSTVVNVLDYWLPADGNPTVDGHTTRNIAPAFGRAYAATVGLHKHLNLWIPPCDAYSVAAWSWEETQQIYLSADNLFSMTVVGSGQSSIIIPTRIGGVTDKLLFHAGGPASQPMQLVLRDLFFAGDSTATNDCGVLIGTEADMSVQVERCYFYALQSNASTSALLALGCDNLAMRACQFMGCGNSGLTAASLISVAGGLFGVDFEQVIFFVNEHRNVSSVAVNPWGGADYEKSSAAQTYDIWLIGDDVSHPPVVRFEQCIFGSGSSGAVWANPSIGFALTSVVFDQCVFRDSTHRAIFAVARTESIAFTDCDFSLNYSGVPAISLADATSPRLIMTRCRIDNSSVQIRANTGQQSVVLRNNSGGDFDFSGCANVDIDAASTWDIYADAGTAAPAARVPETRIVKSTATDLVLTAPQYAYDMLIFTGTPGGVFNVIGPGVARTRFTVVNQTPSACTIKRVSGTGVTIAANMAAQVYHDGSDYVRLTGDVNAMHAAAFSIATDALTLWMEADYAGSPWTSTASAGTSGGRTLTEATNPPTAGTLLGGKHAALFNGTTNLLTLAGGLVEHDIFDAVTIGATRGIGTVFGLIKANAGLPGTGGGATGDSVVIAGVGGYFGVGVYAGNVSFLVIDTLARKLNIAATHDGATWVAFAMRFDGTNLQAAVNSTLFATNSIACAGMGDLTSVVKAGFGPSGAYFPGEIRELGATKAIFSDADWANIVNSWRTTYGIPLT